VSVSGPSGNNWEGRVQAAGQGTTQQYSVILSMSGKPMSFDPFLVIAA